MVKRIFQLALVVFALSTVGWIASGGWEPVVVKREGYRVDIAIGGRPFARYHFNPAIGKPYFYPVRSAEGTVVTRGFPMVKDISGEDHNEPHQRSMYFGHGNINGFDFWGEAAHHRWSRHSLKTFGRTEFRKLDQIEGGPDFGMLKAEFDLITANGKVIASEIQSYKFHGDQFSRTIDCEFTILADHGPVTFGDTKEGTFAIRVAKPLNSPPGHMVNSGGASGEKAIWGKRADWADFYGKVSDEVVGIAVFDNLHNFRHPTYWHARAYGLLAANPFGVREFTHNRHANGSYTIPAGGSLTLRYRVLIHHGDYKQADVVKAYQEYLSGK